MHIGISKRNMQIFHEFLVNGSRPARRADNNGRIDRETT